ncbi:molybdenum cofactor sulfurtransferase [Geosmithia morbida]|uniref:Molybdenum cofactor sulfurtransferase n=1 Tax=Geosmithia morbida TaxID=1094350 RepID=A0A9P5D1P5_9HYPO|nr:molybdenum cofactor sulfurtransferase [Geosmithia morbida]KAF4122972.1 molybdenum cofactor sulfurtransferase [Geosmithia morbida]
MTLSSSPFPSSIAASYPDYETTSRLDTIRDTDYSYLDRQSHVYLDYAGAGLAAASQVRSHADRLTSLIAGNPHSASPSSAVSNDAMAEARSRVLRFFNADPGEYSVIFTANATGAARLVGEAYPFTRGSRLVLTADNHNSINGLRCFAAKARAPTVYVPADPVDLRTDTGAVAAALSSSSSPFKKVNFSCFPLLSRKMNRSGRGSRSKTSPARKLFAYPAQSNFSGVRHPLSWVRMAQDQGYDVLLDAAAYVTTARLDLSVVKPDYATVSWYKLFGFPTGVGCLIARRDSLAGLDRPWFSGGTVRAATVGVQWVEPAADEAAFEDGTPNFLSLADVHYGIDWLDREVGLDVLATRVRCLTGWFLDRLRALRHSDGSPMAVVYGPVDTVDRGGTVAFNLVDAAGRVVDQRIVGPESAAVNISIRTGCFCNPGAGETALGIGRDAILRLSETRGLSFDSIVKTLDQPFIGALRVSFGVASNAADVDMFLQFVKKTYRDREVTWEGLPPLESC